MAQTKGTITKVNMKGIGPNSGQLLITSKNSSGSEAFRAGVPGHSPLSFGCMTKLASASLVEDIPSTIDYTEVTNQTNELDSISLHFSRSGVAVTETVFGKKDAIVSITGRVTKFRVRGEFPDDARLVFEVEGNDDKLLKVKTEDSTHEPEVLTGIFGLVSAAFFSGTEISVKYRERGNLVVEVEMVE